MELGVATTVSLCAAATSSSIAALSAYLGRRAPSRHFRHAAAAGFMGASYCLTDAIIAGRAGLEATLWAGRAGSLAICVHGAFWLAFLAAWADRKLSRLERALVIVSCVVGSLSLVPGLVDRGSYVERSVPSLGITYRDPEIGSLGAPLLLIAYSGHLVAAVAARRMVATHPKARVVAVGLAVFCFIIPLDLLSAMRVLDLPYLADPAIAFVHATIGAVIVADAAESSQKSAELERARAELAEREHLAALGQLAAVVAHEVRNPVAIIFAALATLRKSAGSPDDAKLLGIVGEEANRLKELVARLLEAVRPFELQYSRLPASTLIEKAIAQVTTSREVSRTEVETVSAPPDDVECDEILFVQAVANLVQNAVVATGRRGPVQVRALVDGEPSSAMLRIEVSDDGDGVSESARARLFTPFFTTRATGVGLGLALVKRIAEAHRGTVGYVSAESGGACFVLCVPLRPDPRTDCPP